MLDQTDISEIICFQKCKEVPPSLSVSNFSLLLLEYGKHNVQAFLSHLAFYEPELHLFHMPKRDGPVPSTTNNGKLAVWL